MTSLRKRLGVLAAAATVAALALTGCSGGDTPSGTPPAQDLTFVPSYFPVSLDIANNPAEEGVQVAVQQALETLVDFDGREATPVLAASWEYVTPTELTFQLREDVTFSDGTPFTADDVKASLDRYIAADKAFASLFAAITETRVDGDHTFTIVTSQPVGTLVGTMSLVWIGQAAGIDDDAYWKKPVGTGPFVITDYVADDHVSYARNDDYWGEKAKLDTLTFKNIPEVASQLTALETGEVQAVGNIQPDQISTVEGMDGVTFTQVNSYLYYFLWFNNNNKPFDDPNVRRAMWQAVDIPGIIASLYGDSATPGTAPFSSSVFGYSEQEAPAYDVDAAKQALADAGYPDGFTVDLLWPAAGGPNIDELAQSFISAWAKIGVTVEPRQEERAAWLADFGALNWDMELQTNSTPTGDADYTLNRLYTCAAARLGYCNPELDALLTQANQSVDQDERADLYAQANEIMFTDLPAIWPAELKANIAARSNVDGLVLPPSNRPDFAAVSLK